MMTAAHRATRRYALVVVGIAGLCTLISGITNTTVNPLRVTPVPWESKALEPYRGDTKQLRTVKAGILRDGDWKVAMVGSSRVANALDPLLPQWGRKDVVNLGVNAGFLQESTAIARYFLAHEPAEILLIGVDPGDMTSRVDTRPMFDFETSPFARDFNMDDELRYIFGVSTFDSSRKTLVSASKKIPAEFDATGMRRKPKIHKGSQVKFIATAIVAKIELETADAGGPERVFNEDKVKKLRELLEDARRRNCRTIVFFQSNHALMHAEAKHIGTSVVPFEKERRALASMVADMNSRIPGSQAVELWDFCNYHPLNCEPIPLDDPEKGRLKDWNDLGHFSPEMGTQMLAMMLGWPLPRPEWSEIGVKLEAANLEAYLATVATGYQRYMTRDGARDVTWKEDLKVKAAAKAAR